MDIQPGGSREKQLFFSTRESLIFFVGYTQMIFLFPRFLGSCNNLPSIDGERSPKRIE